MNRAKDAALDDFAMLLSMVFLLAVTIFFRAT